MERLWHALYKRRMTRLALALSALALALPSAPAMAGAGNFTIINATGRDISTLQIRRFGTGDWKPLAAAPRAGARGTVDFDDADCAFDIQAKLADGATAVWSGVNLCEAKAVTLNRNESGEAWADYD
jgi:hypothetical protein